MDPANYGEVRTTDLRTKREVARVFMANSSPRTIVAAVLVAAMLRFSLWGWSYADVVVVGVTLALTGIVEWVIHEHLLHAPDDSFTTRRLGTGIGHRRHHLDPPDVEWVLLGGYDAAAFIVLLALFTALWAIPLLWLIGGPILLPYLSAVVAAYLALANYEWTHLLVHTRYRPRTRYFKRLRRNHGLHHYRNEGYWLGVTTNLGDRLLRTYPADKGDVPLSATARTLEPIPD